MGATIPIYTHPSMEKNKNFFQNGQILTTQTKIGGLFKKKENMHQQENI